MADHHHEVTRRLACAALRTTARTIVTGSALGQSVFELLSTAIVDCSGTSSDDTRLGSQLPSGDNTGLWSFVYHTAMTAVSDATEHTIPASRLPCDMRSVNVLRAAAQLIDDDLR
jgi:hypothetical protein